MAIYHSISQSSITKNVHRWKLYRYFFTKEGGLSLIKTPNDAWKSREWGKVHLKSIRFLFICLFHSPFGLNSSTFLFRIGCWFANYAAYIKIDLIRSILHVDRIDSVFFIDSFGDSGGSDGDGSTDDNDDGNGGSIIVD